MSSFLLMHDIKTSVIESLEEVIADPDQVCDLSVPITSAIADVMHAVDWELDETIEQVNNKILLQTSRHYNGKYLPCQVKAAVIAAIQDHINIDTDVDVDVDVVAHSITMGIMYLMSAL